MSQNFWDQNAWDNGSWVRTDGDLRINNQFLDEAHHRQEQEAQKAAWRQYWLEYEVARRERIVTSPARALEQYQNAIRRVGILAVSEALG